MDIPGNYPGHFSFFYINAVKNNVFALKYIMIILFLKYLFQDCIIIASSGFLGIDKSPVSSRI